MELGAVMMVLQGGFFLWSTQRRLHKPGPGGEKKKKEEINVNNQGKVFLTQGLTNSKVKRSCVHGMFEERPGDQSGWNRKEKERVVGEEMKSEIW